MSENEPEEPQGAPDEKAPEKSAPVDTTDWKAEARKWEQRAKENKSAAEKLAQIEDAQKTEIQKAIERAEAAEKALAVKEAETLRLSIAQKHGITGDALELLHGSDEAELEARAEKLATLTKRPEPAEQKGAWGPFDPAEGGKPSGPAIEPPSPGLGTLRVAYEQNP